MAWTDEVVSEEARVDYFGLYERIGRVRISNIPGEIPASEFSEDGYAEFTQWAGDHLEQIEREPAAVRGAWSKIVSYCARIALIVHMARHAAAEVEDDCLVDVNSVRGAIAIAEYFKSHARTVYRLLHVNALEDRMIRLVTWIRRRPNQEATARDILTSGVAGCKTKEEVVVLFEQLEKSGWGRRETRTPDRGGRETVLFRLQANSN